MINGHAGRAALGDGRGIGRVECGAGSRRHGQPARTVAHASEAAVRPPRGPGMRRSMRRDPAKGIATLGVLLALAWPLSEWG